MKLPHIHIIATGGTIAAHEKSAMQTTGYSANDLLLANELIRSVKGIEAHAEITAENIFSLASSAMDEAHLLQLARRVNEVLADPTVDGLVITHGTDTLEETAFFLYLTVKSSKPVVITGSMLPASAHSADGPGNLINAICTARPAGRPGKRALWYACAIACFLQGMLQKHPRIGWTHSNVWNMALWDMSSEGTSASIMHRFARTGASLNLMFRLSQSCLALRLL